MRNRRFQDSTVGIGNNENETEAIKQALSYLPIENLAEHEEVVVITYNMVNNDLPEKAVVVGPESLRTIIRIFKSKGASRIIAAAGPGEKNTKAILEKVGYDKIFEEEKIEFIDLNLGPFKTLSLGGSVIKETKVNKILDEATVIVSFTQLKIHEEATMSAAIKNISMGWAPGDEHGYPKKNLGIHEDLHDFIFSMAKQIPIDLSIVSLNPAMVGTGPSKGKSVRTPFVLASLDPVACDVVAGKLLGFSNQGINYLYRCAKEGIGQGNIENITIKGMHLVNLEKEFSRLAYGNEFSLDEK